MAKIRLAGGFFQVLVSLKDVCVLRPVPDDFEQVLQLFAWTDLNWSAVAVPVGCFQSGFFARLLSVALLPFGIISLVAVLTWTLRQLSGRTAPTKFSPAARGLDPGCQA